jgi:hypothetical protein
VGVEMVPPGGNFTIYHGVLWVPALVFRKHVVGFRLRHCLTSRKPKISIPDWFFGIYHRLNHSNRTVTLELTHFLAEISTIVFPLGSKGDWSIGLTISLSSFNLKL